MFGTEGSCFGPSTPGKKFFAPVIDEINPHNCVAYNNVIIMCGVNDIKVGSVKNQSDVRAVYNKLKCKVEAISKLNRKAKILVCPVLPTKSGQLNKKVISFNRLIFTDLVMNNYGVSIVHGFNDFVNPADGLLRRDLAKPNIQDFLHLNDKGVKFLASNIKTSIFQRKKLGSRINSGRTFSDAVQRGSAPT